MHYVTAGESHGSSLTAIIDGVPAGLRLTAESINTDLDRRSHSYSSAPAPAHPDRVEFIGGVRFGRTSGGPVAMRVENPDWRAWRTVMPVDGEEPADASRMTVPCPGRADLAGSLKFDLDDCRDVDERANARETAVRVAASGIAKEFLAAIGVGVMSYVRRIGDVAMADDASMEAAAGYKPLDIETSPVRCPCRKTTRLMKKAVDAAREGGDTLGGEFRIVATGLLPGIGGYSQGADRLSSKIAAALFSIPGVRSVEFGLGSAFGAMKGSECCDAIEYSRRTGFDRSGNRNGGIEGGLTNGMPLVVTVAVHPPVPGESPVRSVDMETLEPADLACARGDICFAPSAAVVAEGEVAFVIADAYLKKFGCDSMTDIIASINAYRQRLRTASR